MKNGKKIRKILAVLIGVMMVTSMIISAPVTASAAETDETKAAALSASYDVSDATSFVFSDSGITVTEEAYSGYKISGTALTINKSGTYAVSGACANGTIVVKKNVTGVTLVLNGLTLSASATAPITCNKGSEVSIVAAAGTVNNLADDKYNNDDVYTDEELYPDIENAVIKCKDGSNVTICGSGTINVTANGKNGIKGGYDLYEEDEEGNATDTLLSTASLTIKEITLNITANVNDGLKSDKELNILSGNITISAADDGIKSDYYLNIGAQGTAGPTIDITKSYEGIEGAVINVYSGDIMVRASDDGINAANSDLGRYSFELNVYGGSVYVDAQGDGVDSNGTLTLAGGTVEIFSSSQNDNAPLDSDGTLTLDGGTVLAVGSAGMAQTPNKTSQPYVAFGAARTGGGPGFGPGGWGRPGGGSTGSSISIKAGDVITVADSSGNTLYAATAVRAASYVLFSSAKLTSGNTYTLKINGNTATTATAAGNNASVVPDDVLPFTDVVEGKWYYNAVSYAYENGLMVGVSDTVFGIGTATTRAMAAQILYKLAGSPDTVYFGEFTDVSAGKWYAKATAWAAENGIFAGYTDGSFRPDDPITREQLALVLYKYSVIASKDISATDDLSSFTDASQISSWALKAVKWAVGSGIISGKGGGVLDPKGEATRAELAQILYKYLES